MADFTELDWNVLRTMDEDDIKAYLLDAAQHFEPLLSDLETETALLPAGETRRAAQKGFIQRRKHYDRISDVAQRALRHVGKRQRNKKLAGVV